MSDSPRVLLNGELFPTGEACLSVLDHGLLYGDGLFETVRVANGRLFRGEAHLARLREAAARLALPVPWTDVELLHALDRTAQANSVCQGVVRLTVTRGVGVPVPDPGGCEAPTYFVLARESPVPDLPTFERGIRLGIGGPHPRGFVPGIKSLCYLPFRLARTRARSRGYDDGVLTDGEQAVETATGNLFVVRGRTVYTPGLESGCLPGVTRALILECAAALCVPVIEAPVPQFWFGEAVEAFVTSSGVGVMPVVEVEGVPVGAGTPGPLTRLLHRAYRQALQAETGYPEGSGS